MLAGQYENEQQRLEVLDCLFEYSKEAFFSVDDQWHILELNPQAEIFCQKTRTKLLGSTVWEAFPAMATSVIFPNAQKALQQHENQECTTFSSALDAWFTIRLYPTRAGLAIFAQEIAGRKRAVEEGQARDSLAQAILDSMDVIMAVIDANGNIYAINEAWRRQEAASCTADQIERTGIGMNYLDVCQQAQGEGSEEASDAWAGINAVLQGTRPSFTLEYPCFSTTQQYWYMMTVAPLPQNNGAVVAHIDITERKLFDQQKDTFISIASHELRTPLTALKGLMQLEKKKCEKQAMEDHIRVLTKMETQIDRLTKLVAELLDMSKIQAGTFDYTEEVIDLDALIKEAVEMAQQTSLDVRLNVHGVPTHARITGDWNKLNQVFTNLLSNAIKYSPQVNVVDIYLEASRDSALVSIQDYGIGIPHEHLDHIFERFYRVNVTKRNHVPGLGMGLYITHEIIKHHRGNITVTSEVGKGSVFSVLLPLCKTGIPMLLGA